MPDNPAPTISTSKCSDAIAFSENDRPRKTDQRWTGRACLYAARPAISSFFGIHSANSIAALRCRAKTLSIPVLIRLERAFRLDADIVGLVGAQRGQPDADLVEMQPRHLLVQRLRQHINLLVVFAVPVVGVEFDLRQRLVGEGG